MLEWVRGHWSIEDRSHSVRDVTMGEDASRIRTKSGPQVMAAMRNATIGFLRLTGATKEERKNNLSKFVLRISDLLTIVAACKLQLRSNSSDKSFSLCRL